LLLGPVLFEDFELPERISWGGAQRMAVHQLPGGARVIDTLGRDDAVITWSGVFSGSEAATRARLVDLMRADAVVWPLTWDAFFYSVVVSQFCADFTRSNWIPYRIGCTVLRDEAEGLVETVLSLGASLLSDVAAADGMGSGVPLAGPLSALSAPGSGTLGTSTYTAAQGSLTGASGQISAQLAATDAQMGQATLSSPAALTQATQNAGQLAALAGARGYVQRAVVNLANASS
jgi:hypothetical protein